MSPQRTFADNLLATPPACPPGLTAWNRSDPGRRFAVYRNNVMVSLIDALADTFPVTQALVGEEFFRGMAGMFARAHPPRSPVMAHYGEGFAGFIEEFQPAAGLPYLAGVARLEMLRVGAYHAADAAPLSPEEIARLLSDPERLPDARFALHPSLRILVSPHAVVSLWAAHQIEDIGSALAEVDTALAESALVLRVDLEVEVYLIAPGAALFIQGLQAACCLSDAAGQAMAADAKFDLTDTLGLLLRSGALTGLPP
ncbi:MAG: putative DNA-binding domain-containing protein [Sulfuritalea sp.]|nr:putative DNA-binding domain-containing protein [Sulfuritalea sp.]